MAEEHILVRDIIHDHNERMLNIKKYYPYFKLTENTFTQFQGGKYSNLDMGYILMAVLRFFIEKNNFEEQDVTYEEYQDFLHQIYRRDFEIPLDEDEEKEVSAYIFDKLTNGGRPFSYEYFDPVEKAKKTIRMRLIDSRIREDRLTYFLTSEAIEFYLDTKEIKDESSISIAQLLLSKMIATKNYKGGIDVIKRINSEVSRLKIRKNEVLNILSEDVFAGQKAYEDFVNTGIRWFEDEQKLFAKNMELIENALKRVENDESYFSTIDDIYLLEMELKKTITKHSELLNACTDLQIKADEIINKAKFNRLRPSFDFAYALRQMMIKDRADMTEMIIKPLLKLNIKKSFYLNDIDKLLSLREDKKEEAEVVREIAEEKNYVYEDELWENRISTNYHILIKDMLDLLLEKERVSLEELNDWIVSRHGEKVLNNGDYYSLLVHMCQKKEYNIDSVVEKPDTFFEEYLKEVAASAEDNIYSGITIKIECNAEDKKKIGDNAEISDIQMEVYV